MNITYGDCKREMGMINRAFIKAIIEGDANGRGFQYPIPTYSITRDFDWSETENNRLLFEMAAKYGTPYYTNYSHLPIGYTEDIFSALDVQDRLRTLYTSGTVFHTFFGERLPDWKAAASLVRKIAENYELPYYTLSPMYSICKNYGYLRCEVPTCPECGG